MNKNFFTKLSGISYNSTLQNLYDTYPDKTITLGKLFKHLFSVELFDEISSDQFFSGLYTLLTISVIIMQTYQKQNSKETNIEKYFGINQGISILQIILGIVTVIFALYQTHLLLAGKTFLLSEREFDIIIKIMSGVMLLTTASLTLKEDSKIKQN